MKSSKVQRMVMIAMLAAVSFVLMFFVFPVIPTFSFMQVDFSEIPILIGSLLLGPIGGIAIAGLRSLLHLLSTGFSIPNMIGDFASFLAATALIYPIHLITKNGITNKRLVTGLTVSVIFSTIVMSVCNYTFILPVYTKFAGFVLPGTTAQYILYGVLPFNIIKGILVSLLFTVVFKSLSPWLAKKNKMINKFVIKEERP